MAGKRGGTSDIDSLPQRAGSAQKAVRALSGAFDDLARTGEVTNKSLVQAFGALEALGPAGHIAAAGLRLVAGQFIAVAEAGASGMIGAVNDLNSSLQIQAQIMARADGTYKALGAQFRSLASVSVELAQEQDKVKTILASSAAGIEQQTSIWNLAKKGFAATGESLNGLAAGTRDALIASAAHTRQLLARKDALNSEIGAFQSNERAMESWGRAMLFNQQIQKTLEGTGAQSSGQVSAVVESRIAGIDREVSSLKAKGQALLALARIESEQSGMASEGTLERIRENQLETDSLQAKAQMYRDVGAIADSAIGGTAAGAFDAYANALDKTISLNQIFAGGFDRSMRNMAASVVRSVGQQAAVKGAFEVAEAVGSFAIGAYPMAALHLEAAGLYFGVAALAGVAAGAISVKGAPAGSSRGPGGRAGDSGDNGPRINVTIIGAPDWDGKRAVAGWIAEVAAAGGG